VKYILTQDIEGRACGRDPPIKKEKGQHYMLCQSYPQALKCQIN